MEMMKPRIFHQYPDRALPPIQMHQELAKQRHTDCTSTNCDMKRYCWQRLAELGHRPDAQRGECTGCEW